MKEELQLRINDEDYTLITDYKDDDYYRHSFNRLMNQTYDFDLEQWYQKGYWSDKYQTYSLLHKGEIVANVSVNYIDFNIDGELHKTVQIGTVMTDWSYRLRGLSRTLMVYVLSEVEDSCECIYLYANDSVLDFYPKFDFVYAEEYEYTKLVREQEEKLSVRKLNLQEDDDLELLTRLVNNTKPTSRYAMVGNPGLLMFYLTKWNAEDIYYICELDLIAVASYDEHQLQLTDIYSERDFDLDVVIQALINQRVMTVSLGFTPLDTSSFTAELLKEEGTTFFVRGKNLIDKGLFPELSHA